MSEGVEKKKRGRPKTIDRDKAIDVAMLCYWSAGPGGVTIDEMAKRLGASKPSLYREFGDVETLVNEALERYRTVALVPLMGIFLKGMPAATLVDLLASAMTAEREAPEGCLLTKMRTSPGSLCESTTRRILEIEEELRGVYAAWYAAALERGEVDASLTPRTAAQYIDAQNMMVMIRRAAGDDLEVLRVHARMALSVLLAR